MHDVEFWDPKIIWWEFPSPKLVETTFKQQRLSEKISETQKIRIQCGAPVYDS